MKKSPPKIKMYSVYSGGDEIGGHIREIPVEWDVLSSVGRRCLEGGRTLALLEKHDDWGTFPVLSDSHRAQCFVENKIIEPTPASVTWQLWTEKLGEFGILEIRKIRQGWSRVTFSGFQPLAGSPDASLEKEKYRYMSAIIRLYYCVLSEENIFPVADLLTPILNSNDSGKETIKPIESERTKALVKLAVMYATFNQTEIISKKDDTMQSFIIDNAKLVGLEYVPVAEFKRFLHKAYKAGYIDKNKNGRFIPKLVT